MSILPLFIVITVIVSHIAILNQEILNSIFQKLFPTNVEKFFNFINQISNKSAVFGIFSFLLSFYFASRIFGALHTAINHVFEKEDVPLKRVALIQVFGVPVFIISLIFIYIASFFINIFIDFVVSTTLWEYINSLFSKVKLNFVLSLITDITKIVDTITFFTIVFLIYRYFIPEKVPLKNVLITSIFISVLLVIVKFGFGVYITFASKTNPIYGSLSGVFAFIAWIFITYNIILIGARTIYYLEKTKTQSQGH